MRPPNAKAAISDALGVVAERRTYSNLIYILLAFPLGMVYYLLMSLGFIIGLGLTLFLVGIVVLLGTVLGVRPLASFERWLANALLGLGLSAPGDVDGAGGGSVGTTLRRYLDAPSTWRGLGFVFIKPLVGIVAVVLFVVPAFALSLVVAPLRYPYEAEFVTVGDEPIVWTIGTLPEAALATLIGASVTVAFLHLVNGYAYVCARIAEALLGEPKPVVSRP